MAQSRVRMESARYHSLTRAPTSLDTCSDEQRTGHLTKPECGERAVTRRWQNFPCAVDLADRPLRLTAAAVSGLRNQRRRVAGGDLRLRATRTLPDGPGGAGRPSDR